MWKTPMYNTTKLTVELGDIVENGVKIFDFDYPSYYKGAEKEAFEQKVIDHYYFRQIGFETIGRFKHYLRSRLNEVMPRFIDLYKTVEIMNELPSPFDNVDVTETYTETRSSVDSGTSNLEGSSESSGSQSTESSGTNTNTTTNNFTDTVNQTDSKENKFSDTPQGSIDNLDTHLTNATRETNETINETKRTGTGTVSGSDSSESSGSSSSNSSSESSGRFENNRSETIEHEYRKVGNQGVNTYAHDMNEYRTSIIDVDIMVIDSLNCLFLGVY